MFCASYLLFLFSPMLRTMQTLLKNLFDVSVVMVISSTQIVWIAVLWQRKRDENCYIVKNLFNTLWVATQSYFRTASVVKSTIAAKNSSICPLSLNKYFMFTTWNCEVWIDNIYFVADEIIWHVSTSMVHPGLLSPVTLNHLCSLIHHLLKYRWYYNFMLLSVITDISSNII